VSRWLGRVGLDWWGNQCAGVLGRGMMVLRLGDKVCDIRRRRREGIAVHVEMLSGGSSSLLSSR
jgi:hypothetical protein